MGTSWSAQIVLPDAAAGDGLATGIQSVFDTVVAEMSNWEAESDISRFNRSPIGAWQALPAGLLTVLNAGLAIADRSGGAFDPAIGHLVSDWDFGPDQRAGSAARVVNAWRAVSLDGDRVCRNADVALDLSGIAKGYGVDAVAEWLLAQGIDNFLVEAGGELRGEGMKPDGQPWWVVLDAIPGLAVPLTQVALCGVSVATSGDYRRFRLHAWRRDSHTIDPRTHAPIRNDVAAVTVVHRRAMWADGWATALGVLGQEAGMALASRENIAALMITRTADGAVEAQSPAFAALLE